MHKVSFLMTVYNGEEIIEESIKSMINQTYQNIEIVIVNDGSEDKTEKIVKCYSNKDERIVFVNRKENKGRVYSLNEGLAYCTSRFIAINDADDISKLDRIEIMMNFIKKFRLENKFGIVGSSHIEENRINNTIKNYRLKTGTMSMRVSRSRIFFGMPFVHSTFIYNKDALAEVGGFATEVTSAIDYFTLNKISKKYPIYACHAATVIRVINGNNFFLKPEILRFQKSNLSVIEKWQKDNYKLYEMLRLLKRVNEVRKSLLYRKRQV